MTPTLLESEAPAPVVIERGAYRYPPGLRRNLPFYLLSRFFRPGNPILLFAYLQQTYGNIAHYRLLHNHIVFINEPEYIREILINQAQHFIKERTQRRMKILLGEGLITSEGEIHMRQRRIAAPAFHRQRIQAYGTMMVDRAATMRAQWRAGQEIDAAAEMMRLALQVVARTIFDTDVTAEVQSINTEVNAIMDLYNFLIALPRAEALLHLPVPGLMRFKRARQRLDAVVHRMIDQRRASGEDRGDLLSMLLASRDEDRDNGALTDEQVRDEVTTIFLAGYETVANALAWTWFLLAQNPDAEQTLHAELDAVLGTGAAQRLPTVADLPQLRYTEMVLSESMRLYPPAWAMGRQSTAPIELGPYRFPAGTYFFFSQHIMQ
ncbi:MAG TPA: cytochrome P450, partial [Acidobacteriaceae bacterium]